MIRKCCSFLEGIVLFCQLWLLQCFFFFMFVCVFGVYFGDQVLFDEGEYEVEQCQYFDECQVQEYEGLQMVVEFRLVSGVFDGFVDQDVQIDVRVDGGEVVVNDVQVVGNFSEGNDIYDCFFFGYCLIRSNI